jgi:hypothetical protein
MLQARKKTRRPIRRGALRKTDLPTVPEREPDLVPSSNEASSGKVDATAEADPTEDAVRRMIEAAYT